MEANPITACHLAIDDNIFLLNYNKVVVVRDGKAYTNTTSRLQRLVRYRSSEYIHDVVRTRADDSEKQYPELLRDTSASVVENKGYRLHWQCEDMFIPCRVSGLYFPDTKMGKLLELQYLIECKPDDSYFHLCTKVLEYALTKVVLRKVQFHEFSLIPGYSIQLNWLGSRRRKRILLEIGKLLCFQKTLEIVSFEYQRLDTFEGVKLLLSLAQGTGNTLKELFLWYFFKGNTCPLIDYYSTNEESKSDPNNSSSNGRNHKVIVLDTTPLVRKKVGFINRNKTPFSIQIERVAKKDSKISILNSNRNNTTNKKSSEKQEVFSENKNPVLSDVDQCSFSTWIENWIMDIWRRTLEVEQDGVLSNPTTPCSLPASESHSIASVESPSSHQTSPEECENTCAVVEDVNSTNTDEEKSLTVATDREEQKDKPSITFDELCKRFHRTSELDLLAEIKRRVTQPVKIRSKKIKLAKLRSVTLCECYKVNSGLEEICDLCQRNAKQDLTYSAMDKLELEREIHQLLYFPLNDKRVYFLDDEEKCFQNCQNYMNIHTRRNIKEENIRMIYKIVFSAFTSLTRLSINYNYLADGSGETLLCIGSIRKGELTDLEILCTKNDIPSNSKQSHTPSTRRHSIPNSVWQKTKCLCPQLRVHLVIFGIPNYNSASLFLSKNMPLTSLHISTGNNIAKPTNFLKPGETLDLWDFDQVLKSIGMFHDSLVRLSLELWFLECRTDNVLVKLLMKLKNLEKFLYRGPIQDLQTINRICDFCLENEKIIELKIWKIQEPLLRPEEGVKAIRCMEKRYKPEFDSRNVDFVLESFPF